MLSCKLVSNVSRQAVMRCILVLRALNCSHRQSVVTLVMRENGIAVIESQKVFEICLFGLKCQLRVQIRASKHIRHHPYLRSDGRKFSIVK